MFHKPSESFCPTPSMLIFGFSLQCDNFSCFWVLHWSFMATITKHSIHHLDLLYNASKHIIYQHGDHTLSSRWSDIAPTLSPMLLHATIIFVPLEMITFLLYMANVSYISTSVLPHDPQCSTTPSTLAGPIRVVLCGYEVSSVHHMWPYFFSNHYQCITQTF